MHKTETDLWFRPFDDRDDFFVRLSRHRVRSFDVFYGSEISQ
jgi:hypothetical protein